jgi:prefoldin subunit 5
MDNETIEDVGAGLKSVRDFIKSMAAGSSTGPDVWAVLDTMNDNDEGLTRALRSVSDNLKTLTTGIEDLQQRMNKLEAAVKHKAQKTQPVAKGRKHTSKSKPKQRQSERGGKK